MNRLGVLDPKSLPHFDVLEALNAETILEGRMDRFVELWKEHDPPAGAVYDVEGLEFDPIKITQESSTYFELLLRDRVNQAARSVTLAFAVGGDLDAIASRYPGGVPRLAGRRRRALSPAHLAFAGDVEPARDRRGLCVLGAVGRSDPSRRLGDDGRGDRARQDRHHAIGRRPAADANAIAGGARLRPRPQPQGPDRYRLGRRPRGASRPATNWTCGCFPASTPWSRSRPCSESLEDLVTNQAWLGFDHTRMAIAAAAERVNGVADIRIVEPAATVAVDLTGCVKVTDIVLNRRGRRE